MPLIRVYATPDNGLVNRKILIDYDIEQGHDPDLAPHLFGVVIRRPFDDYWGEPDEEGFNPDAIRGWL